MESLERNTTRETVGDGPPVIRRDRTEQQIRNGKLLAGFGAFLMLAGSLIIVL